MMFSGKRQGRKFFGKPANFFLSKVADETDVILDLTPLLLLLESYVL